MVTPPEDLLGAALYRFADWPNSTVPNWRAGVYGIWRGDQFVYVGMAGRGMSAGAHEDVDPLLMRKSKGLRDRLNSHASGRRSGDQFCVYVCDRLVLPSLTPEQLVAIGEGSVLLDHLTRQFIRDHLTYRFVVTDDGVEAAALERHIQRQGLGGQRPLLNPGR